MSVNLSLLEHQEHQLLFCSAPASGRVGMGKFLLKSFPFETINFWYFPGAWSQTNEALMKKFFFIFLIFFLNLELMAEDWPQFRRDSQRRAYSKEKLPEQLHLQWQRRFQRPSKAWKDKSNASLGFDESYEIVSKGDLVYVPSMIHDSISAFSVQTGDLKWRYFSEGPVRFAPLVEGENLLFTSDDGFLYCLDAGTGKFKWKFNGGPQKNKILGNRRFISMWPARGGPAVYDGKVYFAASIWPFMGIFYHCLDIKTGKHIWTNSGSGQLWMSQPHGTYSFAGIVPQGYLSATEKFLIITGGRSRPALYDRKSGKFINFIHTGGVGYSTYFAVALEKYYVCKGLAYDYGNDRPGAPKYKFPGYKSYFTDSKHYSFIKSILKARKLPPFKLEYKDSRGRKKTRYSYREGWSVDLGVPLDEIHMQAGDTLYASYKDGTLLAVKLADAKSKVSWKSKIQGTPWRMIAANGKLFVMTLEGELFCFGKEKKALKKYHYSEEKLKSKKDAWGGKTKSLLTQVPDKRAYALVLGIASGRLIEELLLQSELRLVVIEPSREKIDTFRKKMQACTLYGNRISVHQGNPLDYPYPPYMAELILSEAPLQVSSGAELKNLYKALRPYGGKAFLSVESSKIKALAQGAALENAGVKKWGDYTLLIREGALKESGDWTHQYAGPGRSVIGDENRVKLPLGLLWFGGDTVNDEVLPRHGHGPNPQVAGGRLYIEGQDMIRCTDIYTGRLLWQRTLKNIGYYYRRTGHHPGANEIGSNLVSMSDFIYVMAPEQCYVLSALTGKTVKTLKLPGGSDKTLAYWGSIAVQGKYLIATGLPIGFKLVRKKKGQKEPDEKNLKYLDSLKAVQGVTINVKYSSASQKLFVFDRHSGKLLWSKNASINFRHNAIALSENRVFFLDSLSPLKRFMLKMRGVKPKEKAVLYAAELQSGKILWKDDKNVFGTWLCYSKKHKFLFQTGSRGRDRARDEVGEGLVCYEAKTGKVLWQELKFKVSGPLLLWKDEIISGGTRYSMLTGKANGKKWKRTYGCNTAIGAQNLLTFRSGAAGFYDLARDGGTGNLGGFKSSCTSNLIPAGGILNAPDYTRTCSCSYQNQSSLAFIHMPSLEFWTFYGIGSDKRAAYNISAVGDRKDDNGSYWQGSVRQRWGKFEGEFTAFRQHSFYFKGDSHTWVAASGIEGQTGIVLSGLKRDFKKATLRLIFAEPQSDAKKGDRIFSIFLNGKLLLKNLDILAEAGGPRKVLIKTFKNTAIKRGSKFTFKAQKGKTLICGIEMVEE